MSAARVQDNVVRGQYGKGLCAARRCPPTAKSLTAKDPRVETFVAMRISLTTGAGVACLHVRAGKSGGV